MQARRTTQQQRVLNQLSGYMCPSSTLASTVASLYPDFNDRPDEEREQILAQVGEILDQKEEVPIKKEPKDGDLLFDEGPRDVAYTLLDDGVAPPDDMVSISVPVLGKRRTVSIETPNPKKHYFGKIHDLFPGMTLEIRLVPQVEIDDE